MLCRDSRDSLGTSWFGRPDPTNDPRSLDSEDSNHLKGSHITIPKRSPSQNCLMKGINPGHLSHPKHLCQSIYHEFFTDHGRLGAKRSEPWKHLEMNKCRSTTWKLPIISYPIGSMHGVFNYIDLIFMVNVGKYTIHGLFGYWLISEYGLVVFLNEACHPNELLPWR